MCLPVTGKQLVFLQPGQVSMADGRIQAEVIAHFLLHPTELLGPQSPAAKGDGEAAIGSAFWVLAGYDELVRLLERVVQPLRSSAIATRGSSITPRLRSFTRR